MGTKAPSETKELRVVACDSLSDEHGTGLPPGVGEEAYLRLTLIRPGQVSVSSGETMWRA